MLVTRRSGDALRSAILPWLSPRSRDRLRGPPPVLPSETVEPPEVQDGRRKYPEHINAALTSIAYLVLFHWLWGNTDLNAILPRPRLHLLLPLTVIQMCDMTVLPLR